MKVVFWKESSILSRKEKTYSCKKYLLFLAVEERLEDIMMYYSGVKPEWSASLRCMGWQKHIVDLSIDS